MAKQIDSSSSVLIREIRVSNVSLDCSPKKRKKKISQPIIELADDEYWRVQYTIILDRPTPNIMFVNSVNKVWQSDDPGCVMMEQVRNIIQDTTKEYSINCESDMAKYYMLNSSPLEYLWAKANVFDDPETRTVEEGLTCRQGPHQNNGNSKVQWLGKG